MTRIGRFVVPGLPHHVTQRGNRRERVFFGDDDYALYRDLLREACGRFADLVDAAPDEVAIAALSAAETIGRPLGAPAFLDRLAALTGRDPRPGKRGRKSCPKQAAPPAACGVPS
ncbi:MAG: transposase [Beijerinckiaceae bacterium]